MDGVEEIIFIVLLIHGLIKKTDKTPDNDIEKAERLKQEYFTY